MAVGSPRGVLLAVLAAGGLLLVSVLIDRDTNGEQAPAAMSAPPSSQAPPTTEEPVGPAA